MQCIEACTRLDASDPARLAADSISAGDLAADDLAADDLAVDAGAPPAGSASTPLECPELPFPCERLCWELDARFGRGRPTTLTSLDTTDDTDLAAIGEPIIRCAQARAAECRAGELEVPAAPLPGGVSWTSSFLECAGLPLDFDLFD